MASTLVLAVVFLLDLVAFSLAVAAEQRRASVSPFSFQGISHLLIHYMLVCLLAGSVRNAHHIKYRTVLSANPPSCETLRKGVFGAGAAFVVFTGIASELYYVFYSKSDEGVIPTRDTGIRMGAFN
ncbi:hypothetical protein L1987_12570 [Smallanthus sonchifolius]|uniref:Uncharacterized protein n=1 Tax=Smallanthus sonchifolius TaxID=185202 RepID=A0ACB9JE35_9ASTR|nr:hypothetical protein L1987_12570 [Smallanthus sonchifolius]